MSYGRLAEVIDRVSIQTFEKTMWPLEKLRDDLHRPPDDVMARYRTTIALGDRMWQGKIWNFQ